MHKTSVHLVVLSLGKQTVLFVDSWPNILSFKFSL